MRRLAAVLCLTTALAACSKEEPKQNCIDPNTYANICIEQAIAEEERKSSSYLDMKYAREDKIKDFQAQPVEVQKEQIAQGSVPTQTVVHHHNNSGSSFITGMLVGHLLSGPSSAPAQQTFAPRPSYVPPRPLGSPLKPFVAPVATPTARQRFSGFVSQSVAKIYPSKPVKVPVIKMMSPKPTQPAPKIRTIPLSSGTYKAPEVTKPIVTPKVIEQPKKTWNAPVVKSSPTPAPVVRPSVSLPKPSYSSPPRITIRGR